MQQQVVSSLDRSSSLSALELSETSAVEASIVIPCLNEADTVGVCVQKALRALREAGIAGEVIVADNGSTDGSDSCAERLGARVVHVLDRGYGRALMGGIAQARGKFIIMGDADDSYDFAEIPRFLERLRQGFDLVQGCRMPAGGGVIASGAMPFLHRRLGNPLLTAMARWMFGVPVHDVYCGLRGFTKALYERLELRCIGMEFATEMIVKASLLHARISEVAITLYRDGRKAHRPHLRTFSDGWRTIRFFLIYCPRWLFLVPGTALVLLGLLAYVLALPSISIGGVVFDAHTLLLGSLFLLLGYQTLLFGIFAKTFAISEGLLPRDSMMSRAFELVNLEKGLLVGCGASLVGVVLVLAAANEWRLAGFGDLDYSRTMRFVVPGVMLSGAGFQTILSSFMISILGLHRK